MSQKEKNSQIKNYLYIIFKMWNVNRVSLIYKI